MPANETEAWRILINSSLGCLSSKVVNIPSIFKSTIELWKELTCQYIGHRNSQMLNHFPPLKPVLEEFIQDANIVQSFFEIVPIDESTAPVMVRSNSGQRDPEISQFLRCFSYLAVVIDRSNVSV